MKDILGIVTAHSIMYRFSPAQLLRLSLLGKGEATCHSPSLYSFMHGRLWFYILSTKAPLLDRSAAKKKALHHAAGDIALRFATPKQGPPRLSSLNGRSLQ